ncbi:hypothetical protein [Thermococcus thermotolerans]|nr:hypothetical protein [Thermococcus thermotolerans]
MRVRIREAWLVSTPGTLMLLRIGAVGLLSPNRGKEVLKLIGEAMGDA